MSHARQPRSRHAQHHEPHNSPKPKDTLVQFLRESPLADTTLDITRENKPPRERLRHMGRKKQRP
jgi:hypothetical protein